jgi:hypothetical protein
LRSAPGISRNAIIFIRRLHDRGHCADAILKAHTPHYKALDLTLACPARGRRQWVGKAGDSLAVGGGVIWLTDYSAGTISRAKVTDALMQAANPAGEPFSPSLTSLLSRAYKEGLEGGRSWRF